MSRLSRCFCSPAWRAGSGWGAGARDSSQLVGACSQRLTAGRSSMSARAQTVPAPRAAPPMVSVKKCHRRPMTAMATPQAVSPAAAGISRRAGPWTSGRGGRPADRADHPGINRLIQPVHPGLVRDQHAQHDHQDRAAGKPYRPPSSAGSGRPATGKQPAGASRHCTYWPLRLTRSAGEPTPGRRP
jgi:hypothetical protein